MWKSPLITLPLLLILKTSAASDVYQTGVIQVNPRKAATMVSSIGGPFDKPGTGRNYILRRGCPGTLLVVSGNDNEGKTISTTTGSRPFVFLPCTSEPKAEKRADGRVVLKMGSGHEVVISHLTGRIESISGATFEESPYPTMKNEGGIRIKPTSGMIMDGGWMMGENPFIKMARNATLLGPKGASCAVPNNKFLRINKDREFEFQGDSRELRSKLKAACPSLDFYPWDVLEAQKPSASPQTPAAQKAK